MVESSKPNGYCYLYSKPSSIKGTNLGRHDNGEIVKVIRHEGEWYYVVCSNGKTGYIHDYALTKVEPADTRERYIVYNNQPGGYTYLYDQPDSSSMNLGRYENGEYVRIDNWYADEYYAYVMCERTNKYGYINKLDLINPDGAGPLPFLPTAKPTKKPTPKPTKKPTPKPTKRPTAVPTTVPTPRPNYSVTQYYAQINSYNNGYCYLYEQPNEYSRNLGRHNNGEWVRVIDATSNWSFALVECLTNETFGYIRKDCLIAQ